MRIMFFFTLLFFFTQITSDPHASDSRLLFLHLLLDFLEECSFVGLVNTNDQVTLHQMGLHCREKHNIFLPPVPQVNVATVTPEKGEIYLCTECLLQLQT